MMNSFSHAQPSAIISEFGYTVFYFDVQPKNLRRLPPYTEFNLVYSPNETQGWEALRYRVSHNKKGYCVIDRHPLEPNEIAYFEQLLATTAVQQA